MSCFRPNKPASSSYSSSASTCMRADGHHLEDPWPDLALRGIAAPVTSSRPPNEPADHPHPRPHRSTEAEPRRPDNGREHPDFIPTTGAVASAWSRPRMPTTWAPPTPQVDNTLDQGRSAGPSLAQHARIKPVWLGARTGQGGEDQRVLSLSQVLRLTLLSPAITEAILNGPAA